MNIDLSGLDGLKALSDELKNLGKQASAELAQMTYAKAVELAGERLKSTRQKYIEALSVSEQDGLWVVSLDASMRWRDDGMEAFDMKEGLLASPKAKRAEDGSTYVVVPFEHGPGKGPTNSTPEQLDLVDTLKAEFKKRKIPWAKVERDSQGRPKIGRLHKFNVEDAPLKTKHGPGQGRGGIGDVRQGPNMRQRAGGGPGGGGIPFLRGVAVYQSHGEGGGVKRSVMTFRIVSSKQQGQDIWHHPGLEGAHIFDAAWKWALEEVEKSVLPRIIERLGERL